MIYANWNLNYLIGSGYKMEWLRCPVCNNKTRIKIRKDTVLLNFPLFCPKCKQENLIEEKNLNMRIIKEPDAKTQSR